jgi:hypothetical protein
MDGEFKQLNGLYLLVVITSQPPPILEFSSKCPHLVEAAVQIQREAARTCPMMQFQALCPSFSWTKCSGVQC